MRISRKRLAVALCLALVGALPASSAAPAAAAEAGELASCITIIHSTPAINADLDGDGNPDVRAPRITDVEVCQDHGIFAGYHLPRWGLCNAGWHPTCIEVYVTTPPVSVGGYVRDVQVCYTLNGTRSCIGPLPPLVITGSAPREMCFGIDPFGVNQPCT